MTENNLILVVDDSPTVLHGTCRILQKAGYETIEASTGMDGLRLTIEHKPDLVLLDVVLPDIYGYEVCRRIKSEANLTGTLVILISSLDTHENHQTQGLEIGADGYIARPVSNRNLLAHIKSLLRLKAAEDNLRQSELKFRTVADFTYDWEYWIAPDACILYMSPSSERITGYQRDEFINNPELLIDIIHKDDRYTVTDHLNHVEPSDVHIVDFRIITRNGEERWIAHQCQPIFDDGGKFLGRRVSNRDITDRKFLEQEKQNLIDDLQTALSEVKKLSGFLPICSSCKKIRDDKGYWSEVERYISEHSEAEFSHGICPDCVRKLYPEIADKVLGRMEMDEKK
jgi:PAS domain S-box-containing protein